MKPCGNRGCPFLLTLYQRHMDGRFDDQVLGRWREVTGGGFARARARATVCPGVIQENPYPLSRERCQLLLHLALRKLSLSHTPPLAFFIICSFASTSASSVLTFSDDVNTQRPTSASSAPNALNLRNWLHLPPNVKLVRRLPTTAAKLAKTSGDETPAMHPVIPGSLFLTPAGGRYKVQEKTQTSAFACKWIYRKGGSCCCCHSDLQQWFFFLFCNTEAGLPSVCGGKKYGQIEARGLIAQNFVLIIQTQDSASLRDAHTHIHTCTHTYTHTHTASVGVCGHAPLTVS